MIFLQILFPDEEIYKNLILSAADSEWMFTSMKNEKEGTGSSDQRWYCRSDLPHSITCSDQ